MKWSNELQSICDQQLNRTFYLSQRNSEARCDGVKILQLKFFGFAYENYITS